MAEPLPGGVGTAAAEVRRSARLGFTGLTVGRAPGYRQANLAILPARFAAEFLDFCAANAAACPVLGVGEPGSPFLPELGEDVDVRVDLPRYAVHRSGQVTSVTSIEEQWSDDLVAVALGCWFGAEAALQAAGVRLRHVELGIQGPLFVTTVPTAARGRFAPPLVVSMRPFRTEDVPRVRAITAQLPMSHGAPFHEGSHAELGIFDVGHPQWGEAIDVLPEESALFWPCGLTATEALREAGVPFFVTHAPGSMLVTDVPERMVAAR